jgi:nicotinate (nicotinamide) nucleotide adenylyltransferase
MTISHTIIFGITADPIHLGHEQAIINGIQYLRNQSIMIKEFVLIPVYQPNLIADKKSPKASFYQRLEMCNIVAKRLSNKTHVSIVASDIEKHIANTTGEKNYSLNTIKHLKKQNSLFMVSADHFTGRWPKFRKWYGWNEILQHSGLLINQRPGHKINTRFIDQLRQLNSEIYVVENHKSIDTSSSYIRASFHKKNMNVHLSTDVIVYINNQNLYGC